MNGPFFRNYTRQQPSRYAQSVPVRQTQQRSSPKIISVPVHFISSDQPPTTVSMLKDSAALKIQKVFRGFVVRKSVKKIASIRNEVSDIERRIQDTEVFDLIRGDSKERLRVYETLMSLLFKLDSIRGVDSGVRDLRKAVTRKAIALQEKVDSISQPDNQTLNSSNDYSAEIEPDHQILDDDSAQIEPDQQTLDSRKDDSAQIEPDHQTLESSNDDSVEIEPDHQTLHLRNDDSAKIEPDHQTLGSCIVDSVEIEPDHQTLDSPNDDSVEIEPDHQSMDSPNDDSTEIDVHHACTSTSEQVMEASNNLETIEDDENGVPKDIVENCDPAKDHTSVEVQKYKEGDCGDYGKRNRDLLNQLMADNEKMMKLMFQISERNELQTRMINSLSQRVEQLERVFMADRLRKKKRTHVALRRRDKDSFCI